MSVMIKFEDFNGKTDVEMAKKVYNWCKENYEWFTGDIDENKVEEGQFFINNDGIIVLKYGSGIFESEHPEECEDSYWFTEIYEQFSPAHMFASTVQINNPGWDQPYSMIWFRDGEIVEDCGIEFGPGVSTITKDGSDGYLRNQGFPFEKLRIVFKNKKTGEWGISTYTLNSDEDTYYISFSPENFALDEEGKKTEYWSNITSFENPKEIISLGLEDKAGNPVEIEDEDDWEFLDIFIYSEFSDSWTYADS